MSVHQLDDCCWELVNPGEDDDKQHFEDAAGANSAVMRSRKRNPKSTASVRLLESPCWLVQCDGECEQVIDEEDEGITRHHESQAEAESTASAWEWVLAPALVGGPLAYCPEDRPEDTEAPLPSAEELEAAGQMRLPGVPS